MVLHSAPRILLDLSLRRSEKDNSFGETMKLISSVLFLILS